MSPPDTDQLARLRAVIDARLPVPPDLASWLLERVAGQQSVRDKAINDYVRHRMTGASLWSRCEALAESVRAGDRFVIDDLGHDLPTSAKQLYRIVSAT